MKASIDLIFEMEGSEQIFDALVPESDSQVQRSKVDLELSEGAIRLKIEGDDLASVRAALNTWIRLVKIAWEMVNV